MIDRRTQDEVDRTRVRLLAFINISDAKDERTQARVQRFLGRELTKVAGGCTMSLQKGFWSPEANARDRKAYADTTTQEETVLRVEVSVMKDVVDDIYRQLQATMAEIQKHDLPSLEAVHVEVQEAEAKHFNLMMGTPVPVVPLLGRIRPRNEGVGGAG